MKKNVLGLLKAACIISLILCTFGLVIGFILFFMGLGAETTINEGGKIDPDLYTIAALKLPGIIFITLGLTSIYGLVVSIIGRIKTIKAKNPNELTKIAILNVIGGLISNICGLIGGILIFCSNDKNWLKIKHPSK